MNGRRLWPLGDDGAEIQQLGGESATCSRNGGSSCGMQSAKLRLTASR
jgi:hypothetical protein